MYRGLPCENREKKSATNPVLESPKFENVIGNNKRAEANIAGITPAVFIFKGR